MLFKTNQTLKKTNSASFLSYVGNRFKIPPPTVCVCLCVCGGGDRKEIMKGRKGSKGMERRDKR